jgi:D-threonate/D-erythronate kinase
MAHIAVIADDLTGANDTAVQFTKHGLRSSVMLQPADGWSVSTPVTALDTESRSLPCGEAYERARKAALAAQSFGARCWYKKIDSTLRGNVGAEIQAVAEVVRPELTIIAPAFPRYRRTTRSGVLLLDGKPVSQTEMGSDPKSPVRQSYIPEVLRLQTETRVGVMPIDAIRRGPAAVINAARSRLANGERWLVFDVEEEADLGRIAHLAADGLNILWVGSTGLAGALAPVLGISPAAANLSFAAKPGPVLIIAGSVSQTTREQTEVLLRSASVKLVCADVPRALRDLESEVDRCLALVRLHIEGKPSAIVISSAFAPEARGASLTEGARVGLCGAEVSTRTAEVLGTIAAGLAGEQWAGVVLTGGDTAFAVCRALDGRCIHLLGEIVPGIPVGDITSETWGSFRVVTKAGGFGDPTALVEVVEALKTGAKN